MPLLFWIAGGIAVGILIRRVRMMDTSPAHGSSDAFAGLEEHPSDIHAPAEGAASSIPRPKPIPSPPSPPASPSTDLVFGSLPPGYEYVKTVWERSDSAAEVRTVADIVRAVSPPAAGLLDARAERLAELGFL